MKTKRKLVTALAATMMALSGGGVAAVAVSSPAYAVNPDPAALSRALNSLTAQTKWAVLTHCIAEVSYNTMSAQTGIPIGVLRQRVEAGVAIIKAQMNWNC